MIFSSQLKKLDGMSTEESLKTVSNHLRKMQEELEYRLSVLDSSNISEINADQTNIFASGENINNVLKDQSGNLSQLTQTVTGLSSTVQNQSGDISRLQQTATSLSSTISNQAGDISALQQTAEGLTSTVSSQSGTLSTLQQTAESLTSTVASQGDSISVLQQTDSQLSATVSSLSSNLSTTLKLDNSGLYITNQAGQTVTISGSQIDASTIKVSNLYGSYIYLKSQYGNYYYNAGLFSVTGSASSNFAVDLTSYGALRMTASYGDTFVGSDSGYVTLSGAAGNTSQGNFRPSGNNAYTLGAPYYRWTDIYSTNSEINTSDRELKTDITYGLDEYEETFKRLLPVSYRFKDGTSGRRHIGFISQDVEEGLEASGKTSMDFAGFVKSPKVDEDGNTVEGEWEYALRYGEFIALNTHMIQKLMGRVEELERRVAELESQ